MVRKGARATALPGGKAAAARPAGPDATNLAAARPDLVPQRLRNDPQQLAVLGDDPLGLRLFKRPAAAGPRIAAVAALVPHPAAPILLVVENARHRAGGPPLARPDPTRNRLLVEDANDRRDGVTADVEVEDAPNDRGLGRVDLHAVALGPGTTRLVVADGPHGNRTITEGSLADEEVTVLLTDLTTKSLGLQIGKKQLVEHPAKLDVDFGVGVRGVDTVGHRNETDVVELEIKDQPQHEKVVPREPREIVDEDNLKEMIAGSLEQAIQSRPIPAGPRLGLVGIDVVVEDDKTTVVRRPAAGENLIRNALRALILGRITRIDGSRIGHKERSFRGGAVGEGGAEDASSVCRTWAAASNSARWFRRGMRRASGRTASPPRGLDIELELLRGDGAARSRYT